MWNPFKSLRKMANAGTLPAETKVKVLPDLMAASILYWAGYHLRSIEEQFAKIASSAGDPQGLQADFSPPLSSEVFGHLAEELLYFLVAIAQGRVYEHLKDQFLANLYYTCLVRALKPVAKEAGFSLSERNLRETYRAYSPYCPSPVTVQEVQEEFVEFVLKSDLDQHFAGARPLVMLNARTARSLGLRAGTPFFMLLCFLNGIWFESTIEIFQRMEPDLTED